MKKASDLNLGVSRPELVDEFMSKLKHPKIDVAQYLRTLILGINKEIGEGIFWNAPAFYFTGKMKPFNPKDYKRYIVGFNFYKKDCIRLIFLRGSSVKDPSGLLEGSYEDGRRLLIVSSVNEVKSKEKELKKIVKEILNLIKK